jgi:hypothetical protein
MRILNRSPNGALSQTHMANTRKLHLLVIFDAAAAAAGGLGVSGTSGHAQHTGYQESLPCSQPHSRCPRRIRHAT